MRDIAAELKELRLPGMVGAWDELKEQDESALTASRWLIEHLLQAEHTDRAMRSVSHQMFAAKFPLHRDLAGFDFASSKVDQALVRQLATLAFTDTAQNVVSSAVRARARRIWPPPWQCQALGQRESGCAFTRPSTWSMCSSARSAMVRRGGWRCRC